MVEGLPEGVGPELGFVPHSDITADLLPPGVLTRAREQLSGDGKILIVGQTDTVGPNTLNRSLGLQFAVRAARRLAEVSGASVLRFGVTTRGEVEGQESGVTMLGWNPPAESDDRPLNLAVLEPPPGVPSPGRFWGIWKGAARRVLWAHDGPSRRTFWEIPPHGRVVRLPVPGRSGTAALAADLLPGGAEAQQVAPRLSRVDPALRLRDEAVELGWVRLRGRVPEQYTRPLVWAGGIPYPVVLDSTRDVEVAVARVGVETDVYLQVADPDGSAVVGPLLQLPDDGVPVPDFLAVLVWEGTGVDLDLHVWDGVRHTHSANPDAAYSTTAVPGMRLLFDGDARQPAAAVAGWGQEPSELSVHCYSDLDDQGATAWVYVVRHAADPLMTRRQVLGPRHLSEQPTHTRWPVLQVARVLR